MKAERRHELKENDLLHAIDVARRYLEEHGTRVAIMAIVVLAAIAAVAFGTRSRTASIEDIWRRRSQLTFDDVETGRQSLDALAAMIHEASDEQFILSGLIDLGVQSLRLANKVDFPPDEDLNEQARQAFEELLQRFPDNPLAVGVAHNGLATVEENEFALDGDPAHKEAAQKHLAAVIDNPSLNAMPFQRIAMDRRDTLDETFSVIRFDNAPRKDEEEATAPGPTPDQPIISFKPIFAPKEPEEPAAVDEALPVDTAEPVDVAEPVDEEGAVDEAEPSDAAKPAMPKDEPKRTEPDETTPPGR